MHPFEVLVHPLKSLTDDVFELKAAGEKNVFRMWEMKDESLKSEPDFKDVLYCFFFPLFLVWLSKKQFTPIISQKV